MVTRPIFLPEKGKNRKTKIHLMEKKMRQQIDLNLKIMKIMMSEMIMDEIDQKVQKFLR